MRLLKHYIKGLTVFEKPVEVDFTQIGEGLIAITGPNGCLVGDTLIDVPRDLAKFPQGVPLRDLVGTGPLVYSLDTTTRRFTLVKACNVRKTGERVPVYRVRYTTGTGRFKAPAYLTGTLDHPVMLIDGTYRRLGDLRARDRLMPIFRRSRDGEYAALYHPDGTLELEHRLVAGFMRGVPLRDDEDGHHRDENTVNNAPDNIQPLTATEHSAHHGTLRPVKWEEHPRGMAGKQHSETAKQTIAEHTRLALANPDTKARQSKASSQQWDGKRGQWANEKLLRHLYIDERLSTVQIAGMLKASDFSISYWLKKFGIPRRSLAESQQARRPNHCVTHMAEFIGHEDVYDMEVPGLHNFVANGVVVHNSGKTSLLESIFAALYRYLPSRDGALYKWCTGRDAQLGLTMDFNGHRYEARVLIDAMAGKDEAFLKEDDQPLVNGKVTAFGKEITRIFGSPDFILSSLFSTQKKNGSFSRIPVSERKSLFIDLLGLGHYPDLEQKAKRELERESLELEWRRGELRSLSTQLEALAEIERQITANQNAEMEAGRMLQVKDQLLADLQQKVMDAVGKIGAARDIDAQLATANDELTKARAASQDVQGKITQRQTAILEEFQQRHAQARMAVRDAEAIAVGVRGKIETRKFALLKEQQAQADSISKIVSSLDDWATRKQNNTLLLSHRDRITAAVARKTELETLRNQLNVELTGSIDAEQSLNQTKARLSEARGTFQLTEQRIQSGNALVAELETIPCGARDVYAACPKILSAVETKKKLPELIDIHDQQADMIRELETAARQNGHRSISDIRGDLGRLDTEFQTVDKEARLLASLEQAEERIAELDVLIKGAEKQKQAMESQLAGLSSDDGLLKELLAQESQAVTQVLEAQKLWLEIDAQASEVRIAIGRRDYPDPLLQELLAQQAISDARYRSAGDAVVDIRSRMVAHEELLRQRVVLDEQVRMAEQARRNCQDDYSRLQAEIRTLQARRSELERVSGAITELEQKIEAHKVEISDWSLLVKALSKDGIPALEIDAAGPGISAIVNDLLSHCFSSRFAIDLQTQRLSADGKRLLEDFDIRVLDNKRGAWGPIGGLSGGEEVVVNEAIGFGIAIYNKSNRRFETAFRDETTGSLDPVAAVAYVDMLKRARVLGSFHQVLFITHSSECAELADARIHCENGTVSF